MPPVEEADLAVRLDANQVLLHYRIIDLLGEGGAGVVYKARDTRLDRIVVVKILKKSLASQEGGRERFLREARLASALDHPNIAGIHDIHEWNGTDFIVMQYVEGVPLSRILSERKLDLPTALSIAIQVCDALAHAHARGIIHRDVKPSNILVTEDGQAKILDFGLAKRSDREGTEGAAADRHGGLIGTPLFISPELARGEPGDARTDIFSMAIMLYQLFTGKLPFSGSTRAEVLAAVLTQDPLAPSHVNRKLPPRVDAVVMNALAKDPGARTPTMRALLEGLEDLARDAFQEDGVGAGRPGARSFLPAFLQGRDARHEGLVGQLLGKVFHWSAAARDARAMPLSVAPKSRRRYHSVAVLPFTEPDDGPPDSGRRLGDRIASELGRSGSLTVSPWIALSAAMQHGRDPRGVGQRLSVQAVLTGTCFRSGQGLRLSSQLIRVETGETIWSDTLDVPGPVSEASFDDGALQISRTLLEHHLGRPGARGESANAEASACVRRGAYLLLRVDQFCGRRADLENAEGLFSKAASLDPSFAAAWSGLGACQLAFLARGWGEERHAELAESHLDRALKLDGESFEAKRCRLPLLLRQGRKETARAQRRLLAREHADDPRLLGISIQMHRYDGLYDAAFEACQVREHVDPLSVVEGHLDRGRLLLCQNDPKAAFAEFEAGLELEPAHGDLRAFRAHALYARGEIGQAAELLARQAKEDPASPLPRLFLAMCAVRLGNHRQAFTLLDRRLLAFGRAFGEAAYWIGGIHAALLEKPEALTWLRRAAAMGYENYPWYVVDFNLLSLRAEPGFVSLLEELRQKWNMNREALENPA